MKQIIVKKCRYCPYVGQRHGELYCKKIAEAHQNEMGLDDIHKDCPLVELPSREACKWEYDDAYGIYTTGCGKDFITLDGSPSDNLFKFCLYCGGEIHEVKNESL